MENNEKGWRKAQQERFPAGRKEVLHVFVSKANNLNRHVPARVIDNFFDLCDHPHNIHVP
jgi:hypothetical protein